jgi:hypothetical protein
VKALLYGALAIALQVLLLKESLDVALVLGGLLVGLLASVQESMADGNEIWSKRLLTLLYIIVVGLYYGYR